MEVQFSFSRGTWRRTSWKLYDDKGSWIANVIVTEEVGMGPCLSTMMIGYKTLVIKPVVLAQEQTRELRTDPGIFRNQDVEQICALHWEKQNQTLTLTIYKGELQMDKRTQCEK